MGSVLGLDIGGANLKAATAAGRAVSVPFPLWKKKDELPAALAELIGRFPGTGSLAVTMTGELCDCFETKREGVAFILDALPKLPTRVWTTDGKFVDVVEAKRDHMAVAAANWHASATFAGQYAPSGDGLYIDIGSTTTDLILLDHGVPSTFARTDYERLESSELVYTGTKRTPLCAFPFKGICAEFFAESRDVNIVLGYLPETNETDTADGRPATRNNSIARLARMFGGDAEVFTDYYMVSKAERYHEAQLALLVGAIREVVPNQPRPLELRTVVLAGSGEWLAAKAFREAFPDHPAKMISLTAELGKELSSAFPAYALAMLADER